MHLWEIGAEGSLTRRQTDTCKEGFDNGSVKFSSGITCTATTEHSWRVSLCFASQEAETHYRDQSVTLWLSKNC